MIDTPMMYRWLKRLEDFLTKAMKSEVRAFDDKILQGENLDIPFQQEFIDYACAEPEGIWAGEGPPGFGKSRILAAIAAKIVRAGGKVLVISPNRTGMGDELGGLIQEFHKYFAYVGLRPNFTIGKMDKLADVVFMTPQELVNASKRSGPEFEQFMATRDLLELDEMHHFPFIADPLERDKILKIYGKMMSFATTHFKDRHKKVVGVSATAKRLDGLKSLGKSKPDHTVTIQQVIDTGFFPPIYGIEIFLDVKTESRRRAGDLFSYNFDKENEDKYFKSLAECMYLTYQLYPFPTCAFARTKNDAKRIAREFNELSGLGDPEKGGRGLVVMTHDMPIEKRKDYIRIIKESAEALYGGRPNESKCLGYVTCAVGEESINIPPMMVVHLIRRTCSNRRNVQAVGRGLRAFAGKCKCLVLDYRLMKEGIIKASRGEYDDDEEQSREKTLLDLAKYGGVAPELLGKINQGGILIGSPMQRAGDEFLGQRMQDEEAWIVKQSVPKKLIKQIYQSLKRQGKRVVQGDKLKLKKDDDGNLHVEEVLR